MNARLSTTWRSRAAAPLLAVLLAAGADAQITATLARCPIPRGTSAWSRPSTWPGGVVPGPGTDVVIPAGQTVVLDFDNVGGLAHVKSLRIEGALHVSCGGGTLRANSILVNGGTFAIGAAHRPYPHDVTITSPTTPRSTTTAAPRTPERCSTRLWSSRTARVLEPTAVTTARAGRSWRRPPCRATPRSD